MKHITKAVKAKRRRSLSASCLVIGFILAIIAAVFAVPGSALALDDTHETLSEKDKLVIPIGNAETIPPLPAIKPMVGPVFKRGYADDVDRWTTAFIPRRLDSLTPVEFPETDGRWIRVDLSEQVVIAYEGDRAIRGFVISSGLPRTPTVKGTHRIRVKVPSQNMSGGDRAAGNYYDLDNVQWVQYFYADYSFHGTYWHNDFGQPKSHGCLNMTISDAKWLFDWASPTWDGYTSWYSSSEDDPGTIVVIHD